MVRWLVSILLSLGLVLGVSQAMAASPPGLTCPAGGNVQTVTAGTALNDGVQSSRFTRAGNPAGTCAAPHVAPAVQGGNYGYDKFVYTNRSATAKCITVTLTAASTGNPGELQSAAYAGQGGFHPANITANYLADSGPGTAGVTPAAYSFTVAALADFEVVVTESNDGQGGGYTLNVAGCGEIVIVGHSPTFGPKSGGTLVGVAGSGFSPTGVAPTVTFGANAAAVPFFVDGFLNTVSPPDTAGVPGTPSAVAINVQQHPSGAIATENPGFTYYDDIATSTTLAAVPNQSVFTQTVTLTATVALTSANPGLPAPGNVAFYDGAVAPANLLGTGTVNALNVATITVGNFSVGSHNLIAVYTQTPTPGTGELVYLSSTSATVIQVVAQSPTSTSVTSLANPSGIGAPATFTAEVKAATPGTGVPTGPTGTVTFSADGVPFASAVAIDPVTGLATASTSTLALGTHVITVTYSGDTNYTTSTGTLSGGQVVSATATGITLVANPASPSTFGQSVTFTVTLTGGVTPPGGTVIFRDGPDATSPQIGTTQTVSGAGTAAITIATLAQGAHTIRADYSGDTNHQAGQATIPYTVNAAATTTTLTSSVNPSSPAQSVTVTATVTSTVAGTIGGTVTFKDGANTLGTPSTVGTGGVATLATTALTVGSHNITAVYAGAGNYGPGTSSIVVQVVRVVSDAGPDAAEAGKDTGVPDAAKADTGTTTDSGSAVDSGGTPKTDAGSDAGDGTIAGGGDDGCGCTTAGTPSSGALSVLMWAGVGILVARRRKRNAR